VFSLEWGTEGTGEGQFAKPKGVAVASDGSVYVADSGNNRIQKFTAEGVFVSKWGTNGSGNRLLEWLWSKWGTAEGQFDYPAAVAVASDGSVYVADSGNNRIQKFTADGVFVSKWGTGGGPIGVAVASDGSVYVSDNDNHRIQKFTSAGVFVSKWGTFGSGDGQFNHPMGVAVGSDGSVYVADSENKRIQKFTADGVFVSIGLGESGQSGPNGRRLHMNRPDGVAVASDGSVYVVERNNHRIVKLTSEGVFVSIWKEWSTESGMGGETTHRLRYPNGPPDGQFSNPSGVAVAPDGSVYVTDTAPHRIHKFSVGP